MFKSPFDKEHLTHSLIYRPTYYDRFRDAFISEVQTFCDVVLDDKRKVFRANICSLVLIMPLQRSLPRLSLPWKLLRSPWPSLILSEPARRFILTMKARQLSTRHELSGIYMCVNIMIFIKQHVQMHRMGRKCYVPGSPWVGRLIIFCGVTLATRQEAGLRCRHVARIIMMKYAL